MSYATTHQPQNRRDPRNASEPLSWQRKLTRLLEIDEQEERELKNLLQGIRGLYIKALSALRYCAKLLDKR